MSAMQAVVLCGGLGTRLRPLTEKVPKPMVELNGKPFLEHLVLFLKKQGFSEFLFLSSYLHEKIESHFGNGKKFGVNIAYSVEEKLLGTGGALLNAEQKLGEEFLLVNGDTFLPINFRELIQFYRSIESNVIVAYIGFEEIAASNLQVEGNKVLAYNKAGSSSMNAVDAGIQVLQKDSFSYFPKKKEFSLEEDVFPVLARNHALFAFPTEQRFYDMGSKEKLKALAKVIK